MALGIIKVYSGPPPSNIAKKTSAIDSKSLSPPSHLSRNSMNFDLLTTKMLHEILNQNLLLFSADKALYSVQDINGVGCVHLINGAHSHPFKIRRYIPFKFWSLTWKFQIA